MPSLDEVMGSQMSATFVIDTDEGTRHFGKTAIHENDREMLRPHLAQHCPVPARCCGNDAVHMLAEQEV